MDEEGKDLPQEFKDPIPQKSELTIRVERVAQQQAYKQSQAEKFLPGWPDGKRGVPNSFIRSALFPAIQGGNRKMVKRHEILTSHEGLYVRFSGEQLNQSDLNVWQAIVQLASPYPLGTIRHFSAYEILKMLDLTLGSSEYKYLYETIIRLAAGLIQINHRNMKKGYFGHLIEWGETDQDSDPTKEPPERYEIHLNLHLMKLFGENDWTALDWKQRRLIRNKPLASALHAFYSSHKDPFALKVETLHGLVGSENKDIYKFKYRLKIALSELKEIRFLTKYSIEDDLVHVHRSPIAVVGKRIKLPYQNDIN